MTNARRTELAKTLLDEVLTTLSNKGRAYSGDDDANSNFKEVSRLLGMTKYQVWAVYFVKHVQAILNAIHSDPINPVEHTEGMRGRIIDAIAYLTILQSLLLEDMEVSNGN